MFKFIFQEMESITPKKVVKWSCKLQKALHWGDRSSPHGWSAYDFREVDEFLKIFLFNELLGSGF